MQNYKIDILTYHSNNQVNSKCADITFQNTGTSTVTINNGFELTSGSSLAISANENEEDNTIYTFYFNSNSVTDNNLIVLRKIYI